MLRIVKICFKAKTQNNTFILFSTFFDLLIYTRKM